MTQGDGMNEHDQLRELHNRIILAERHIANQEERILKRNQTIRAQKKQITELKGDLTRLRINNMGLVERVNQFADEKQELRERLVLAEERLGVDAADRTAGHPHPLCPACIRVANHD